MFFNRYSGLEMPASRFLSTGFFILLILSVNYYLFKLSSYKPLNVQQLKYFEQVIE